MTINYKVFAAGDTLSANDLLTYIENQAVIQVDNEAELTTLNTTYPSVRVAFAQDTDKMYVNNDGVWEAVVSGASPSLTNLTLTGNLTVQGTTTTIDSATIAVKDKFIFEGATADAHETTLQVAEPTADRTITLPDATGTVALTSGLYALPSQTGNSGKYLKTDGTNETWSIDATSDLITTAGDIVYGSAADTMARLGIGTANQILRVNSGATAPEWATPSVSAGVPAGAVISVAMNTAPTGFLKANGAAISRSTYADLFTAIGTTFGVGDGSTTFNVPDMRGYFTRNWADNGSTDSGRTFGTTQSATSLTAGTDKFTPSDVYSTLVQNSDGTDGVGNTRNASIASSINVTFQKVRPVNLALLAVIKY